MEKFYDKVNLSLAFLLALLAVLTFQWLLNSDLKDEIKLIRQEMSNGFEKVDDEFIAVRQEMSNGFEKIDEEFITVRQEMSNGFEKVDDEFIAVRQEMNASFTALNTLITEVQLSEPAVIISFSKDINDIKNRLKDLEEKSRK